MTDQSKLIQKVSREVNISASEAKAVVEIFFDCMTDALIKDERITIRNLWSFTLKEYKNYEYTDPETNKTEILKYVTLTYFKCGKELEERINNLSFSSVSRELEKKIKKFKNIISKIEQKYLETLDKFFDALDSAKLLVNKENDNLVQKKDIVAEVKSNFENYRNEFERLSRDNFNVVFVGYYNAGKSSLINALIKEKDFFPTGPIPTTKEIHAKEWENLTLVDTPGIDSMDRKDEELARQRVKSADLSVFVTTAESELDRIEIGFLRDIVKVNKKVLFVVNKIDRVSREAERNIIAEIEKQLKEHLAVNDISIIPVSARDSLDGLESSDTRKIERSNICHLQNQMIEHLRKDGINLRIANLTSFVNSVIDQSVENINELLSETGKESETISKEEIRIAFNKADSKLTEIINDIDRHLSSKNYRAKALDEKYGQSKVWRFLKSMLIVPTLYDWLNGDKKADEKLEAFINILDLEGLSSIFEKKVDEIENLLTFIDDDDIQSEKVDKTIEECRKKFENKSFIDFLTPDEEKVLASAFGSKQMFQKWLNIFKNTTKRQIREIFTTIFSTQKDMLEIIDQFENKLEEAKKILNIFQNYLKDKQKRVKKS